MDPQTKAQSPAVWIESAPGCWDCARLCTAEWAHLTLFFVFLQISYFIVFETSLSCFCVCGLSQDREWAQYETKANQAFFFFLYYFILRFLFYSLTVSRSVHPPFRIDSSAGSGSAPLW